MDSLAKRVDGRSRYRRRRYCKTVWWSGMGERRYVHRHYCVRRRWHRGPHRDLHERELRRPCS